MVSQFSFGMRRRTPHRVFNLANDYTTAQELVPLGQF